MLEKIMMEISCTDIAIGDKKDQKVFELLRKCKEDV